MATTEIPVKVTADTRDAERNIKNFERSLGNLQEVSGQAAAALGIVTGAAAAMTFAILKTAGAAGDLVDASDALGVSAAGLQKMQYAAQLAGVGADALNASIQKLSKNIYEGLIKSSAPAADAMNSLGLNIKEINALRPDEQFRRVSEALMAVENPAQRVALSMELFGKQGPAILKVAGELEKVRAITESVGLGVTEQDIVALDEASDAVDQLAIMWDAGVKKAVAEIAPLVIGIVTEIQRAIKEAGGFEGIWKAIKSVVHTVVNVATILGTIIATRLIVGAAQFAIQLGRAAIAAKSLNVILSRTPIGLLAAGAAILADAVGIDLVGGMGDVLDLTELQKIGNDKITAAVEERNTKLTKEGQLVSVVTEEQKKLAEAQKKALEALNDTIIRMEVQVGFQRDILENGQEEARINQVVNTEREKLKKVNLDLLPAQEQSIRNLLREEDSLKRQINLRQEQTQAVFSNILAEQSAFEQALQKQLDFRLLMEGKTAEEIRRIRQQELKENPNLRKVAEASLDRSVQRAIDAEIGKNNKLYELQKRQAKEREDLDRLELSAQLNNVILTEDQKAAIIKAKEDLYRQQQLDRLAFDKQIAEQRTQVELDRIDRILRAEAGAAAQALSEKDREFLQKQGMIEKEKQIAADRVAFEKKSDLDKTKFALDNMTTVFSTLGAQNKKAFEASKALAIASALVNTYQGATKALATYPWPFGLIAAAAAVAAGMAQVAAIRSQQYSGRALGGPVMGGKPYIVGESGPELFTPATTGSITRNSDLQGGSPVNVTFTIIANDTQGFDQLLTSRQGVIKQIISDAMLERGQRSMM